MKRGITFKMLKGRAVWEPQRKLISIEFDNLLK